MDDTSFLVYQTGYRDGFGADGNQLKSLSDVNIALAAGIPMITLDLEESLPPGVMDWTDASIRTEFGKLPKEFQEHVKEDYFGQTFQVERSSLAFDAKTARRCAVLYHRAIGFVERIWEHIGKQVKGDFDLEISLFDKPWVTPPEHHLFLVRELVRRGVRFSSFAPRFVDEFIRGCDFPGNTGEFARQFGIHCEIARTYGDYKISIHTGSDKFRIHPLIGRLSLQHFHLKTAGTSWLEAMALIAEKDPTFYRVLHKNILDHVSETSKYYSFIVAPDSIPDLDTVYDDDLPELVRRNPSLRQLLHVSYGTVLNSSALRPILGATMHRLEVDYHEAIKTLFTRHLEALGVPGRTLTTP
jgi:hypothetical protein